MSTIVTRAGKGSPLTHTEVDSNFTNLNTDKYQSGNNASFGTLSASDAFSANGGATLGDASGDALTINSSAVSIPNGLNFDSNTLVIDATNNLVGIGTNSPSSYNGSKLVSLGDVAAVASGESWYRTYSTSAATDKKIWRFGNTGDGAFAFQTVNDAYNAASERMRITDAGNVGIGTSSPNSYGSSFRVVQVSASTGGLLQATGGTVTGEIMGDNANSIVQIGSRSNHPVMFKTNDTERMRIDSSGNVGIGTSSPTTALTVAGVGRFLSGTEGTQIGHNGTIGYIETAGNSATPITFYNGGTERMRLDSSGNLGLGTTIQNGTKLNVMGGDNVPATSGTTQNGGLRVSSLASGNGGYVLDMGVSNTNAYAWMQVSNSGNLASGFAKPLVLQPVDGNVGLGVVPNDWTLGKSISVGDVGSAVFGFGGYNSLTSGAYFNSGWKYSSSSSSQKPALFVGSDGAFSWSTAAAGTAGNAITFTQAMTLDASGNLGIGITNPADRLSVYNASSDAQAAFGNSTRTNYVGTQGSSYGALSAGDLKLYASGGSAVTLMADNGSGIIKFATGGNTERMRIDSSGNINIGANNFTARLNVYSSTNALTQYVENARSTNGDTTSQFVLGSNTNNTTSYFLDCVTAGVGSKFYIYGNGTYGTVSDRNLKKNIETARNGYLDDLMRLRVVKYNWNTDTDGTPKELGWIAQELAEVFPGMVQDSKPNADGNTVKEVKTSVLPFILLKAIQEQQAIINDLKARIETLESK